MSYETNPILNRIKILKGWKNPTFPTKTLNYSQEMILWFKVYLFLKIYLWCQNFRLLTCEIRLSNAHTKILHLSISKEILKKKNLKSKWKTKSFLQNLKSPLIKAQNKKTRFLLYRDLQTLKKKSEFAFNINRKKKISKAWISKSRLSSWVNFSHFIHKKRLSHIKEQNFFWKKKKKISFFKKNSAKSKKKVFFHILEGHEIALKKKKNILELLVKLQRDLLFLNKIFDQISRQKLKNPSKQFQNLAGHLKKEYQRRKIFLKKIEKIYICSSMEKIKTRTKPPLIFFFKTFAHQTFRKKIKNEIKKNWFFWKKQSQNFQKDFFFQVSKKKHRNKKKKHLWNHNLLRFLAWRGKNITFKKLKSASSFTKIYKMLLARHFQGRMFFFKTRTFKKPTQFRGSQVFKLLRFEQKKKQFKSFKQSSKINSKKISKKIYKNEIKKKRPTRTTKKKHQKLAYRLSFRYQYRNYLTITTNLKLKYLIADLIQEYFSLVTHVKLLWPLQQFKNLNFYRLIFPNYYQSNFNKKKVPWKVNKNLRLQQKRYLYISQNTNHLKIQGQIITLNKKARTYKKLFRRYRSKLISRHVLPKKIKKKIIQRRKSVLPISKVSTKAENIFFLKNLSNFWQKNLKRKNKYLILKKKIIKTQSEKRLFWASKQKYISNLIITLTLFAKYLEVQPLADHLAKIISETKKHALILKVIKNVLRTLSFKRGVGYRIALIGRINGVNKSRTFYLKKLNRNRSRQTFSKNVNFAMAQAQATIGAFGVKIWVYS